MEEISGEGLVVEGIVGGDFVARLVLKKKVEKSLPVADRRLEGREMKNQMGSRGLHLHSMVWHELHYFATDE